MNGIKKSLIPCSNYFHVNSLFLVWPFSWSRISDAFVTIIWTYWFVPLSASFWMVFNLVVFLIAWDICFLQFIFTAAASFVFVVWGNSRSKRLLSWGGPHSKTWIARVIYPAILGLVVSALRSWSCFSSSRIISCMLTNKWYFTFITLIPRFYLIWDFWTIFLT